MCRTSFMPPMLNLEYPVGSKAAAWEYGAAGRDNTFSGMVMARAVGLACTKAFLIIYNVVFLVSILVYLYIDVSLWSKK